ncbi:acyltransferase family protein [Butyrivibrio sp. WCE2006]|uniref:acyltransferase family protein n=1 Tax=Butyrivibrio sp. WCE2006 TaxID=1410611 RepID=UPI001A9A2FDE
MKRNSGIELLKVIAIFLVVFTHVSNSLSAEQLLNIKYPVPNFNIFFVYFAKHFGGIGNIIFVVCSSWFLCDSKRIRIEKILKIIVDVWIVSVSIFIIYFLFGLRANPYFLVTVFFPNLFGTNWFITCYMILYLIHPGLVFITDSLKQRSHAIVCIIIFTAYFVLGFIRNELLYSSDLIVFVSIFIIVSYIKKYMNDFHSNIKCNLLLLCISVLGLIGLYSCLYYLSITVSVLGGKFLITSFNNNPFALFIAIALFNILSNLEFYNKLINNISSMSLLIYIFHENKCFRLFTREKIWLWLIDRFGMRYLIIMIICFSFFLLTVSCILSFLYKKISSKFVLELVERIGDFLIKVGYLFSNKLMNIK